MKKTTILALMGCFFIFSSCKKKTITPAPNPTVSFMNRNAGSIWNYEVINNTPPASTNTYSLTSTDRDSTITSNQYHVYSNSGTGASEYYRVSGTDYYTYQSLPAALGGTKVENLYLKAGVAVGTTWPQTYNITYNSLPLAITLTDKIEEKGISRTVNSITYNNVTHVSTSISVAGIPATSLVSDIQYYYAPNYGMIENTSKININYFTIVSNTDITTRLKTATLQ
jgi:hypothetical protein